MCAVDLDDGLNDSLFYLFHAVELFIQNSSCFHGINGAKGRILPLNVQHNGERSLCMPSLIRSDFRGAGNHQISSRPFENVRRERSSRHIQEIGNTLKAGQLHLIAFNVICVLVRCIRRCFGRKKTRNCILKEPVLCGKLCLSAGIHLSNLVDAKTPLGIVPGKPHVDAVVSQPANKILEPFIDFTDIGLCRRSCIHKMERGPFLRKLEAPADMMQKLALRIFQNKDRMPGICGLRILPEGCIGANFLLHSGCFLLPVVCTAAEIKYLIRHILCPP